MRNKGVNILSERQKSMIDERIWAEIDLSALAHNVAQIKQRLGAVGHMAVIKADAYGHGAIQVARTLAAGGVNYLAVACLSEAIELRQANVRLPILILGFSPISEVAALLKYNLAQTVFDVAYAEALSRKASELGKPLTIHIKVDTGMSRLGVFTAEEVCTIARLPFLHPEGLFTHLATADKSHNDFVAEQVNAFTALQDKLEDIKFSITHCANSGGMLYYKETWFNMVRTGLLLFGASDEPDMRPVMHLQARIAQIKEIPNGATISYDRTYIAPRAMRVAVVCAGYADGYMRAFSNTAEVICRKQRVRVVGRVCMDMLLIDVTDVPNVSVDDIVTLFGADGLSAASLASHGDTIAYEVLCAVSRRVPRMYLDSQNGDAVKLWSPRVRVFHQHD